MDTRDGGTRQVLSQPMGIVFAIGTGVSDQAEYPDVEDTVRTAGSPEAKAVGKANG